VRILLAGTIAALLLAACGAKGPADTPRESFLAWKDAMASRDWAAVWDLLPPSDRARAEKEREKNPEDIVREVGLPLDEVRKAPIRELFAKVLDRIAKREERWIEKLASAEFVREEIHDARAKVFYKVGDEEETVRLVLDEGKWYVPFDR
jgi:predicted small lipoprotein YifL